MTIVKATIYTPPNGINDVINLYYDIPSPSEFVYPGMQEKLVLSFYVKRGLGKAYVEKFFRVTPEVVKESQ